ncbi:MAG TPA: hypothetical protein VH370_01470 [Humisphaera sp.]|nr:hypothetical protein [Humisphaera sp.]
MLLTSLLAGCAADPAPLTVADWRKSLEAYVWEQGNGDPAVLRDVSWDDVHPGFAILGQPLPDHSTDIYGLLLAHPRIDGSAYFVFLVALVRNNAIEQMLPIALDIDAGKFHWTEGAADEQQVRRYTQWQGHEPPTAAVRFPSMDDSFDVRTDGNTVWVSHPQSGAKWRIELPHSGATTSPSIAPLL